MKMKRLIRKAEAIYYERTCLRWMGHMTKLNPELKLFVYATTEYLEGIDKNARPAPVDMAKGMLQKTIDCITEFNESLVRDGMEDMQIPVPEELIPLQVAFLVILLSGGHGRVVALPGSNNDLVLGCRYKIMCYHTDGVKEGIYTESPYDSIRRLYPDAPIEEIACLMYHVSKCLSKMAYRRKLYRGRKFVAVHNGILNIRTKELLPFTHEYVFDSKWPDEYVMGPDGPMMRSPGGKEWDIDHWVRLFVKPEADGAESMC